MKKKGDPSFRWNNKEQDIFLTLWAEQAYGIGWGDDAYKLLATQEGHGYRPRDPKITIGYNLQQQAKRFRALAQARQQELKKNKPLETPAIKAAVAEVMERAKGIQPTTAPSPPAPTPAPSVAPEPPPPPFTLDAYIRQLIREEVRAALAEWRPPEKEEQEIKGFDLSELDNTPRIDGHSPEPPRPRHNPQPFVSERPTTKQVVVCGGNPQQVESVQTAFPDIDVRGCMQDIPTEQDPDLVVIMTKFYGHAHERAVFKKYERSKIVRVKGAAGDVKTMITARLGVQPKVRML